MSAKNIKLWDSRQNRKPMSNLLNLKNDDQSFIEFDWMTDC